MDTELLREHHRRGTVGVCSGGGHELRFWAPAVDRMPEECLATLVAHELGHVLLRARGRRPTEEELVVRRLLWEWGFDEERLDDWLAMARAELRQIDRAFYAAPTLARESGIRFIRSASPIAVLESPLRVDR